MAGTRGLTPSDGNEHAVGRRNEWRLLGRSSPMPNARDGRPAALVGEGWDPECPQSIRGKWISAIPHRLDIYYLCNITP